MNRKTAGIRSIPFIQCPVGLESASNGIQYHIVTLKQSNNAVPDVLVDIAVKLFHLFRLKAEARVEKRDDLLGRPVLGDGSEVAHI